MALTSLSGPTCLRATSLSRRRRPVIELRLIDLRRASASAPPSWAAAGIQPPDVPLHIGAPMLTSDQSAAYDTALRPLPPSHPARHYRKVAADRHNLGPAPSACFNPHPAPPPRAPIVRNACHNG
jgi:hypothetical protein